jgi:hypothetical protein
MKKKIFRLKLVAIFTLICSCQVTNGQERNHDPCLLLGKVVKTKIFKSHFNVCADQVANLNIEDTTEFFPNCSLPSLCNRSVILSSENLQRNVQNMDVITLYKAEHNKNIYILYFVRRSTGATGKFFLKQKREKIKLIKYEWGVL